MSFIWFLIGWMFGEDSKPEKPPTRGQMKERCVSGKNIFYGVLLTQPIVVVTVVYLTLPLLIITGGSIWTLVPPVIFSVGIAVGAAFLSWYFDKQKLLGMRK